MKKNTLHRKIGVAIDNTIGIFAPQVAARRRMAREKIDLLDSMSSYRAADRGRFTGTWLPTNASPDKTILNELKTLRNRSRDLERNDAHATGITLTMTSNTVGTGIRPQSHIEKDEIGVSQEEATVFQRKAERVFKRWSTIADASDRLDFYDIQNLVDRQVLINGEIIIIPRMLEDKNRAYSTALQLIESDRLDTPPGMSSDKSIRGGVKIGENGEPISYFINKTHPGDYLPSRDFIEIPAKDKNGRRNIYHLYPMSRPGQSRGVPFFAPVIEYFKHLSEYIDAELIAARIAACYALVVEMENAEDGSYNATYDTSTGEYKQATNNRQLQEIFPGLVHYANPGEEFKSFNPQRPVSTFDPFVDRILRAISAALGLPYELVAKDFSKVNYSSARAALLEARRYFRMRQRWLISKLCQPVWERVLEEAYLRGEFGFIQFYPYRDAWCACNWIAPGWEWIDPLKEAQAAEVGLRTGTTTYSAIYASQGKDFEEEFEQIKREQDSIEALGINIGFDNNKPPTREQDDGTEGKKEAEEYI